MFADVSEYKQGGTAQTKSINDDKLIYLESLLDRSKTDEWTYPNGNRVQQVPFKSNEQNAYAYIGKNQSSKLSKDSLSIISKFLITTDWKDGRHTVRIATMISTPEYLQITENREISYLFKANFTGFILFSDVYGNLTSYKYIECGRYSKARLLKTNEQASSNCNTFNITTFKKSCATKSRKEEKKEKDDVEWDDELEEITITAETTDTSKKDKKVRNKDKEEDNEEEEPGGDDKDSDDTDYEGGSSDGEEMYFYVDLSVNNEQLGSVRGNGYYEYNTSVTISAHARWTNSFDRWEGDFSGEPKEFTYWVCKNITAMAFFYPCAGIPCVDLTKNSMFPLYNHKNIAPTLNSGYKGGTYGNVRTGGTKKHGGIDIEAPVGTPIYAICTGKITKVVSEQPNRIGTSRHYPEGYNGTDKNDAGNRIYHTGTINGENISIAYFHLQAENAIAINPRTGVPFAVNDIVYQGEIIGYTGITGNANGEYIIPHLHLKTSKNGIPVNPVPYLNGNLTPDYKGFEHIVCNTRPYSEIGTLNED